MHNIIKRESGINRGRFSNPQLERLLKQQKASIQLAINHNREFGKAVNGKHLLLKILYSLNTSIDNGEDAAINIFQRVSSYAVNIAHGTGVTTHINKGDVFKSIFYPSSYEQIILSNDLSFQDALLIGIDDWRDIVPVKPLSFPYLLPIDFIPSGGGNDLESSTVSIDIVALAIMYNGWVVWNTNRPIEERESIEAFVGRWVLPNMLPAQEDVTLRNILTNMSEVTKYGRVKALSLIHITSYDEDIEKEMQKHFDRVINKDFKTSEFIANFPALNGTLLDTLPYIVAPDTMTNYKTKFILWTPIVVGFLTLTMNSTDNGIAKRDIKIMLRNVKGKNVLRKITNTYTREVSESRLEVIKFLIE